MVFEAAYYGIRYDLLRAVLDLDRGVISPTFESLLLVVLKTINLCPEVLLPPVLLDLAFPPKYWIWRLGRFGAPLPPF